MYLRRCLADIEERLGPITEELGLRHSVSRGRGEDANLFFERLDEHGNLWRSPVCFTFPPKSKTGLAEITWEHVRVGLGGNEVRPVGNSGWLIYEGYCDTFGEPIGEGRRVESVDAAFRLAEEILRSTPLMPEDTELPGILNDGDAPELWDFLEPELRNRGIEDIDVERDVNGVVYFVFSYLDVEIRVGTAESAEVVVDGTIASFVEYKSHLAVVSKVEWQLHLVEQLRKGLDWPS
ncbi:hypothetical protein HFO09_08880 [Rhizobium laguerreae]|uniref:hypothetical protein n=1 Tax=Rhizobium laguerreae TaxID=1076926 RepID=UPI001C91C267|nr:hypothetical protein [Rhizobium laguerreae]MBY3255800.1 hypothetical protein [Rhizobium laguerreae]MBY3282839.1 hypothetical protein [Rhizobium laguerreae]MBY3289193.1 hypothetical protein [Rhizobium laguerreae]